MTALDSYTSQAVIPVKIKIIGTPGCGKTFTLRQYYEKFTQSGYSTDDITLTTFRKSSANDLINAVSKSDIDKELMKSHVGTLHSICYRLIGHPALMKDEDYSNFVKEYRYSNYVKPKNILTEDDYEDSAISGNLFDLYSWCRNTMTPPEKWFKYPGSGNIILPGDRIPQFFSDFDEYKRKNLKIDFTDMLQQVLDNHIPLDTSILMVDEFQDLTPQMYAIFEMWDNIFMDHVVIAGDPFQSIYGFWGGNPDFFMGWNCDKEIVLPKSYRLPWQLKDYSRRVLRINGMTSPDVLAKLGLGNRITNIHHGDKYQEYPSELHLVRANYQIDAVAMRLATDGKPFSTLSYRRGGWSKSDVEIANAIISVKNGLDLTISQRRAIVQHFSEKLLGLVQTKDDFLKDNLTDKTILSSWMPSKKVIDILKSHNPTSEMTKQGKLFRAKIDGVKDRKALISYSEVENRRIMTIHASKGLEADAVFLHTAITPRIQKAIVIPGKYSQAEARVWYVAVTRAKEQLYIVQDEGRCYVLPKVETVVEPEQVAEIYDNLIEITCDDVHTSSYADW